MAKYRVQAYFVEQVCQALIMLTTVTDEVGDYTSSEVLPWHCFGFFFDGL